MSLQETLLFLESSFTEFFFLFLGNAQPNLLFRLSQCVLSYLGPKKLLLFPSKLLGKSKGAAMNLMAPEIKSRGLCNRERIVIQNPIKSNPKSGNLDCKNSCNVRYDATGKFLICCGFTPVKNIDRRQNWGINIHIKRKGVQSVRLVHKGKWLRL